MLKIEEIKDLSVEELKDKLNTLKKTLMQFRFQLKTGKLERQSSLRETRQDIARILTVVNAKKKGEKKS